jgi:flavin-dependent dehydrogenase
LAQAGLDVLVLEKTEFPREKVCGDGLTPRAVKQLIDLGLDISEENGWIRNKGLRIVGGGHTIEIPWPQLSTYPDFGLVRTRKDFDQALAEHAVKAGARLVQGANVQGPIVDERTGRITGVRAKLKNADGTSGPEQEYHAPLVVAADGNSTRLSLAMACKSAMTARWGWLFARITRAHAPTMTGWNPGLSCGTATSCCLGTAGFLG